MRKEKKMIKYSVIKKSLATLVIQARRKTISLVHTWFSAICMSDLPILVRLIRICHILV